MTSDDLDRVERELNVRLPATYRALVQTYPAGLGPSGPDYELIDDAEQLIAINRRFREDGFFGLPWPAHFFCFGGDGSGNEYYLDLRRDPSPVCFADHERSMFTEQWSSLESWLAERLKEAAEWQAEEQRRAERKASRRWWQFWICLALAALAGLGCEPPGAQPIAACQRYRPHVAKATFDGRVGSVVVRNASTRAAEVKIYHPDGTGDVEGRWTLPPGAVVSLTEPDSQPLPIGNDWGVQADQSCVTTLGKAAAWRPDEFALRWQGDSLRAGLQLPAGRAGASDRRGP